MRNAYLHAIRDSHLFFGIVYLKPDHLFKNTANPGIILLFHLLYFLNRLSSSSLGTLVYWLILLRILLRVPLAISLCAGMVIEWCPFGKIFFIRI